MSELSQVWSRIQGTLLPFLNFELDPITDKQERLICILEIVRAEDLVPNQVRPRGRPRSDRQALARAYVAKAFYNMGTTDELIERLKGSKMLRRICGWERLGEIPNESTFSRAFSEFAESRLPELVHEKLIKTYQSERLVGHICRDSTEILAREKSVPRQKVAKVRKKAGRPRKGEVRKPRIGVVERQLQMSLHEILRELPRECDYGVKKNSKGKQQGWTGYKLHIDAADGEIPISCILTSASVADVRIALPLMQITATRVTNLYDLMDKGYDSRFVREESERLGHVPIIDRKQLWNTPKVPEMEPARKQRYKTRTTVERVNSRLKDDFGGRNVRVKGATKVMAHLMFGILVLTADQLLKLVT
jgi:hypothetical protein